MDKIIMHEYVLLKKDSPTIKGKHVIFDAKVGGEKLVYKRIRYSINVFKIGNLEIKIPSMVYWLKEFGAPVSNNTDTIVFLRPFKKTWDNSERPRVSYDEWGKKDHPLTNIWLIIQFDYTDISQTVPLIKEYVEDAKLKKLLRQKAEKFII